MKPVNSARSKKLFVTENTEGTEKAFFLLTAPRRS